MRLDYLERQGDAAGPLQRLDARAKLLVTLAFIVGVVATPLDAWRLLAGEGLVLAFVLGLSGLSAGAALARWLGLAVPLGFLAAVTAPGHPQAAVLGAPAVFGAIVAKNGLALGALLVLAGTTPMPRLLAALRRLGVPAPLVMTLHFLYRYLHVLAEELGRMLRARRARTFRRGPDWVGATTLIGLLLLRALERGERVHAAMLARGWDGTIRSLDDPDPDPEPDPDPR